MSTEPKHDPREHDATVQAMAAHLAGRGPELQGAVLGELVARFIAGHHPDLRAQMLAMHIAIVTELVPVVEIDLFGEEGFPVS